MIEVYPHEGWCPRCHVSHPPGTKRCLHCGGGVLPVRTVESRRGGMPPVARPSTSRGPIEIPVPPEIVEEDEGEARAEAPGIARPFRIGIAGLWLLLAVVGALVRACSERG